MVIDSHYIVLGKEVNILYHTAFNKKKSLEILWLSKKPEQIGVQLAGRIKGDVHVDIFNRAAFSTDASIYQIFPQCVAAVRDEEDIRTVVRYARDNNLAIAARGAGSGLAGESLTDGIVVDVRRYMDRILAIWNKQDKFQCTIR